MDIISHGLWTAVAAKIAHKKKSIPPLKSWLLVFFGMLPDIFAFTPLLLWSAFNYFSGNHDVPVIRPDNIEPAAQSYIPIFSLTNSLYNISHSLVIFFVLFVAAYLILKRPLYEMLGWIIHVLIDIPTHSFQLYPTPFLWPLSEWRFDGISWEKSGFVVINYIVISIFFILLGKIKQRPVLTEAVENDETDESKGEE